MDHLYGDGTMITGNQYKQVLEESNNVYNLHNMLFQLTNHIFDGEEKILQTWKNISKMSIENYNDSESWINDEIKNVKVLEENISEYKDLLKRYLQKIDDLLAKNPEIIKAQLLDEKKIKNETLKKLENESKRINSIKKNIKNDKVKQKREKVLRIILQVVTGLVCLLILFLINSKTKFVNGVLVLRKK